MKSVTPIGSCRIAGPLRIARDRQIAYLNQTRVYGYCHSPAEAVQMARFLRNEVEIPSDLWPLVCRGYEYVEMRAQVHDPADLYIIELASAKEITVDGFSIQLNYLRNAYQEFFSDIDRSMQFWERAQGSSQAAMNTFLQREWSGNMDQCEDSELLARIQLRYVTEDSLMRDVKLLDKLLGNTLFVTHIDALRSCGTPIDTRSEFIKLVENVVPKAGLRLSNPTHLMDEFGQNNAIEDNSTALAHYTPEFSAAIGNWLLNTNVELRADANSGLKKLCASADKGKFNPVLKFLKKEHDAASEFTAYQLTEMALKAEALGDLNTAYELARVCINNFPALPRPAACLARSAAGLDIELVDQLSGKEIDALFHALPIDQQLELAITSERLLAEYVQSIGTEEQLCCALEHLRELNKLRGVEVLLSAWTKQCGSEYKASAALDELFTHWMEIASQSKDIRQRIHLLSVIERAKPDFPSIRKTLKTAREDLAGIVRGAGVAGSMEHLDSLSDTMNMLTWPITDFEVWRARVAFKRGDHERAIHHGTLAVKNLPEKTDIWVLMMRAAWRGYKLSEAKTYALHVLDLADGVNENWVIEAKGLLETLEEAA